MSSDRPVINHEGRAQDHSFARTAAASHWGRPEGHVGRSGEHVGQPGGEHVGRPGPNATHIGRPADTDARANAALQQGFQNSGDLYKSTFDNHMGSQYPDGGTGGAGGMGSARPDGAGGMGSSRPDGTVGAGGMGQRPDGAIVGADRAIGTGTDAISRTAEPVYTTEHAGEKPGILARLFKSADGTGTAT